ncbi:FRG domain-containing protein [Chitinophaga sp. SYP-B3965]|uniref:FRG domain-containing protein n=1 Tax=Chitinophaga sp. SYP-B3965 TaxID=2663120 RepID=UPI001299C4E2|nr:FRG domain-containing protein [Chitinophaga sp. SYP-B3965]MRG45093.1 FRG domain-containing protein [Chitinophaga sp. SYP-B3965]
MKYNYPEHYSKNALSAIKLAKELKSKGEYDFFRGQRNAYAIQPSILRPGLDKNAVVLKLQEFINWVHRTPELISLHNNINSILAVAQHYGLKTPLLDFSHSPEIAGFFATDGGVKGDTGTIICINKKRFQESWKEMNGRHYNEKGMYLTELIEIDVNNLWRLQAQQGLFLQCHVNDRLLEMFSYFLHIYFPQENGLALIEHEKIYPKVKSHLEVLLDQYFLIDSYPERERMMADLFGPKIVSVTHDDILEEMKPFFITSTLPEVHESWKSDYANSWLMEPDEKYSDGKPIDIYISLYLKTSLI